MTESALDGLVYVVITCTCTVASGTAQCTPCTAGIMMWAWGVQRAWCGPAADGMHASGSARVCLLSCCPLAALHNWLARASPYTLQRCLPDTWFAYGPGSEAGLVLLATPVRASLCGPCVAHCWPPDRAWRWTRCQNGYVPFDQVGSCAPPGRLPCGVVGISGCHGVMDDHPKGITAVRTVRC
jgi:hypothetical protein